MKSFRKFDFLLENGSHSEMKILRCDKLPPLKGILPQNSGKVGLRVRAKKIRIDTIEKK
jgi:hypothetical protein